MTRRNGHKAATLTREAITAIEARYPALKALNDATLDKPRGFIIAKAEAVRLAGGEKEFAAIRNRWKDSVLALRGITVEYKHAIRGYRFILAGEHMSERHMRILTATERKHREEALRVGFIRDEDIESDHQRRIRVLVMGQHSDLAGKANAQIEHARIGNLRPESLPRLPFEQAD